jgi:pimeloyl-ACP methyl ester carboxylesterase
MIPKTQYARNSEGHVAYQVFGEGPMDIIFVPDHPTNLEIMWEEPSLERFFNRLAALGRVICFDKRGTGLSDPVSLGKLPTVEEWMNDIQTVADAAGVQRTVIYGHGDGGLMAMLFAASHPARTSSLILSNAFARMRRAADYKGGMPRFAADRLYQRMQDAWGTGGLAEDAAPSLATNPAFREWLGRYERFALSPSALAAMFPAIVIETDLRSILPAIRVPTLILHRSGNRYIQVSHGRFLGDHIAGAKYVELPGDDHYFHVGDNDQHFAAIREFLTGEMKPLEDDRILATVLFTDIVGSTERAITLGDQAWKGLLQQYYDLVRRELARHRGQEMGTAGDGFLAAFDGPARAARCALAIRDSVRQLGLEIRGGLHIGECERIGNNLSGIAVHIGARIMSAAGAGEVLASSTVKDLVAGSGLQFASRGMHTLKGIPGDWQLFAVA